MEQNNSSTADAPVPADNASEASRIGASIVETFQGESDTGTEAAPADPAPSLRFADLEMDAGPAVDPAPAPEIVDERPPLEIDGVEYPAEVAEASAPVVDKPALRALEAAGLNFNVSLIQTAVAPCNLPANSSWVQPPNAGDYQFCLREDTGHVFGITGPDYGFVQPSELAAVVDAALPEGSGKVTVQSSAFGDHLWFNVELPNGSFEVTPEIRADADKRGWVHIDPRVNGHTPVTGKLLFKHAYGGKGSYDVWMFLEALICGNGLRVPLKEGDKQIKIRHTVNFESRVQDLKHAFEVAKGAVPVFAGMFDGLAKTQITAQQFDAYCEHLFPGESTQAKNKRKRLAEINATAVGCAPGTAWGALQSATYWATHETSVRVNGRSLSKYTLDDPSNLTGVQLSAIQGQARMERLVYGDSGALTERALQYVATYLPAQ